MLNIHMTTETPLSAYPPFFLFFENFTEGCKDSTRSSGLPKVWLWHTEGIETIPIFNNLKTSNQSKLDFTEIEWQLLYVLYIL